MDRRTTFHRQLVDSRRSALVETRRLGEQAIDDAAEARLEVRRSQPLLGIDAGLAQPVARQVQPAHARILADVAGNV